MNISTWTAFDFVAADGTPLGAGSLDVPSVLSSQANPQIFQNSLVLAQNASGLLWDASTGPADFTYLYISTDVGDAVNGWLVLELTTDENNTFGIKYATSAIGAGIPYILGSSQSYANYTANFGGGTLSKIQRVRARNLNTATANVKLALIY